MKFGGIFAGAVAAAMFVTPAMASTVVGSDITDGAMLGANVHYRFGDKPNNVGAFGGSYWDIAGQNAVFQICAELYDHDEIAPSYTVTSGIGMFGDFRDTQLTALFSNAFPLLDQAVNSYIAANGTLTYNAGLASEWAAIGQYSVALQTLTWIIAENDNATIAPTDPATKFGIVDDGQGNAVATGYILNWAANINDGLWVPKDGVTLYHAVSSDGDIQDRFWMETTSAVPEPASWAMMLIGFGVIGASMRRRPAARFAQAV